MKAARAIFLLYGSISDSNVQYELCIFDGGISCLNTDF